MAEASFTLKVSPTLIKDFTGSKDTVEAMTKVGQFLQGSAQRHAPVRTGNLRRSITYEVERTNRVVVTYVGTNVKYGIFQELGTINHPAHPFLRPALADLQAALRLGRLI